MLFERQLAMAAYRRAALDARFRLFGLQARKNVATRPARRDASTTAAVTTHSSKDLGLLGADFRNAPGLPECARKKMKKKIKDLLKNDHRPAGLALRAAPLSRAGNEFSPPPFFLTYVFLVGAPKSGTLASAFWLVL